MCEILISMISAYLYFVVTSITLTFIAIFHRRDVNCRKRETLVDVKRATLQTSRCGSNLLQDDAYYRVTATSLYALLEMGHR